MGILPGGVTKIKAIMLARLPDSCKERAVRRDLLFTGDEVRAIMLKQFLPFVYWVIILAFLVRRKRTGALICAFIWNLQNHFPKS